MTTVSSVVYSTDDCTRCSTLIRRLTKMGIPPTVVGIDDPMNTRARTLITQELKFTSVPVTVITGIYDQPVYFHDISPIITMDITRRIKELGDDITVQGHVIDPDTGLPQGVSLKELQMLVVNFDGTVS